MRASRPIDPRLLIGAAIIALVTALIAMAVQQLVLSAMSWLVFELLVVLSAIVITTPYGTSMQSPTTAVSVPGRAPDSPARRSRIYPTGMHGDGLVRDESGAPDDYAA